MRATFYGEIVAIDPGLYTNYVLKNLDEPNNSLLRYVTATRLPNWDGKFPQLGDVGYIECEYVNAGEHYYKRTTGETDIYAYTACYFIRFVPKKPNIEFKEFEF